MEYRPSVGGVSAECRTSVDGLAIEYRPTCMSVERRPISTNISAECLSTYRRVSIDISVVCRPTCRLIYRPTDALRKIPLLWGGGQGGGRPGEKGAGGVREAGEEGAGSGIPKVAGSATLRNIPQSKKCKEAGAKKYRAGTGIKGYGKREV